MSKWQNIILWVIIVAISVFALQFAFHSPHLVVSTLFDDAFYYLEIARNISEGKGATFDELHRTNGFHPLWLLMLTGLFSITHIGLMGMARLLIIVQAILLFGSLYLVKRILEGIVNPYLIGVILLIPLYPRFFHIFVGGMEAVLLILLLLVTFRFLPELIEGIENGRWFLKTLALGGLFSAIVLTRLDAFFLPLVVLFYLLIKAFRNNRVFKRYFSGALLTGIMMVTSLAPFLIWNYLNFGTPATISSLMKVDWTLIYSGNITANIARIFPEYFVGVFVVVISIIIVRKRDLLDGDDRRRLSTPLTLYAISSVLLLTFYLLFVKWALFSHAFASTLPTIILGTSPVFVFILSFVKSDKWRRRLSVIVLIVAVALVVGLQAISISRIYRGMMFRIYDSALWARENTPEDAIFAMKDSGCFGYFSDRRTINLDGMVNDFEYQEYLRKDRLEEYLQMNGVDYFVQHAFWFGDVGVNRGDYEEYTLYIPSRLYEGGGTVTVEKEQEVFRSGIYVPRRFEPTRVVMWRYE